MQEIDRMKYFSCFVILYLPLCLKGQEVIDVTWKTLAKVTFYEEYNEEFDFNVLYPKFSEEVRQLDGKIITIEGFAIPIEELDYEDILVLSALPYSQCFFCGMAGPESVIDIKPIKKLDRVRVDTKLRFKGRLKLNVKDLSKLNYILEEAVLIK